MLRSLVGSEMCIRDRASLRTPNSWYTACESLEQNWRPLSESMVRGHPHKGMYFVDQDIGRALRGTLSGSDGEHIGPTTETIGDQQDVGLPYYRVCVSFTYFSSRFSRLHSQAVQRCGSGFGGAASSIHGLVRGTGIYSSFPYFCICDSSRWASVMARPWKAGNYLRNR